ncbi:hypothetical protein [Kocuria rosea]
MTAARATTVVAATGPGERASTAKVVVSAAITAVTAHAWPGIRRVT